MLVSEIKSVGNAVFLEVLVMEGEIGFLAIRIKISYVEDSLGNAYLFISSQIGLFGTFLLAISFLQVKLKLLTFRTFFVFGQNAENQ